MICPRIALLAISLLCGGSAPLFAQTAPAGQTAQTNIDNGRYLYYAGGCASCHAAPASDKCDDTKYKDDASPIGGRCLKTPFGTFNVPNITPDAETGIGGWSDDDFIKAMTEGVSPEGANYYPAFPYSSYQYMTRSDLLDLKTFLDSLTPAKSAISDHDLSFPYNIRWGLSFWKWLYLHGEPFQPDPTQSDQINRGAYLVNGPGHCGECHTPRSWLGGMDSSRKFAGGASPEGDGFIPNITPHETGLGSWSASDIAFGLESGFTPEGDVMGGAMAAVQKNMSTLTKEDREAIAAYLKALPALPTERPQK